MKKTVLITGASSGFGKESAQLFQQNGWNVIASMRSPEKEQELSKLENVLITRLDVQDIASIENTVQAGIQQFGKIDALINNAGYGLMGVFESSTPEQIQQLYTVNVFGVMNVARVVIPHMRENNSGVIINVSSFGGVVALPFGSLYNSSKFAVEGWSEALAHELTPFNIAVKIIEPGSVATNFRSAAQLINSSVPVYNNYMANLFKRYGQQTEHLVKATVAEVAETIYTAVTDGAVKLRYVIGSDGQYFIDIKEKNTEAQFIKTIRELFID
jgi:short-subunit dehydrogenase